MLHTYVHTYRHTEPPTKRVLEEHSLLKINLHLGFGFPLSKKNELQRNAKK